MWHNFSTSLKACAMNVRSFYSTRGSAYTHHLRFIVLRDVPDDGNVSQAGDDSDSESETMEISASDVESGSAASDSGSSTSPSDSDADVSDNDWSTKYSGTSITKQFTRDEGPLILLPFDAKSVEYFDLMFSSTILKLLVSETI